MKKEKQVSKVTRLLLLFQIAVVLFQIAIIYIFLAFKFGNIIINYVGAVILLVYLLLLLFQLLFIRNKNTYEKYSVVIKKMLAFSNFLKLFLNAYFVVLVGISLYQEGDKFIKWVFFIISVLILLNKIRSTIKKVKLSKKEKKVLSK
jgi:hypothetical protein